MKILEFKDLKRAEGYIYYRRDFSGIAVVQIPGKTLDVHITFNIEMSPFGSKTIEINIEDKIAYPTLPVKKALTDYILTEDNEGKLPL